MSRYGELRVQLQGLQWGDGLTRDQMLTQRESLPEDLLRHLPAEYRFRSAEEVMSYFEHLRRHGVLDTEPVMPPIAWGESPTGRTYPTQDLDHGVGSGATTYETGSSGQTGTDRSGIGRDEGERRA